MQPTDQQSQDDYLRSRTRRYDAYYDPTRTYSGTHDSNGHDQGTSFEPGIQLSEYQQSTAYVPPHDVRSGYVPPQVSADNLPLGPSYASPQFQEPQQVHVPQQSPQYAPLNTFQQEPSHQYAPQITQPTFYAQPELPPRIEPQHTTSFATHSKVSEHYIGAEPVKSSAKKSGIFSSIVKASVQIDRVTKQSVKAVRHTFEPPQIAALRSRKQKRIMRTFYTAAAFSMFATVYLGIHQILYAGQPKQPQVQKVLGAQTNPQNDANRESEAPSENVPSSQDIKTYLVAPPYPRYIRIPSINIESRIRRLGVDSSGAVGSPNNIFDTGWYDSSVKPGDKDGVSLIVGHLSGPSKHGVFWELNKLVPGAKIEIEKGNGDVLTYKVTHVDGVQSDTFNIADYLKTETPGRNDLRLITSSGKYDNVSVQGSARYVVFAQQIL